MDGKLLYNAIKFFIFPKSFLIISIIQLLGTLLNGKSQISQTTAKALKEALSRGVRVIIATGKVRANSIYSSCFFEKLSK